MPSLNSKFNIDAYKHLHISQNPDGSLIRNYPFPFIPLNSLQTHPIAYKDITLNKTHKTSIRVFIPKKQLNSKEIPSKLPIILYFHGGGFILCNPSISLIHDFTARLAASLPAVVLSVDHRLAPEHRLPACYDDALDALLWLQNQSDAWLENISDFSRIFLMGSSSGGNIAYHLALRAMSIDITPLKIAGIIMDQPFFGGEERTESEMRMAEDKFVPLAVTDLMWELALPVGANRDHEYSSPKLRKGKGKGLPKFFVRGYLGDPLIDRMREMVRMLEEEGVSVVALLEEEGFHGVEMFDEGKAEAMVDDVREFVYDGAQ